MYEKQAFFKLNSSDQIKLSELYGNSCDHSEFIVQSCRACIIVACRKSYKLLSMKPTFYCISPFV